MEFFLRRLYHGPIKLVVFDWAGTTIDYGCCAPAAVFVEGYRRRGIEITLAQARGPMGLEKRDHIRVIGQMPAVAQQWQQKYGSAMTEADIDQIYHDFVPILLDTLDTYAELIPHTVQTVHLLRQMGCQIGATTGYFEEAMQVVLRAAARQGYVPDSSVSSSQVPAGRPAPWMMFETMRRLNVYPPQAVVKVGDTIPDIGEGVNTGCWSVGVVQTGNEVGLSYAEWQILNEKEQATRMQKGRQTLTEAGAFAVIDTLAELPALIAQINDYLAHKS